MRQDPTARRAQDRGSEEQGVNEARVLWICQAALWFIQIVAWGAPMAKPICSAN